MSSCIQIAKSWPGFRGLKRFFIFGDSYSSVGGPYANTFANIQRNSPPDAANPLGVEFPGDVHEMWNEPESPNWVGHLLSQYIPEPRFDPYAKVQDPAWTANPTLVADYAIGGETVSGVKRQVSIFLDKSRLSAPSWRPDNSLFVVWVGINDCASSRVDYDTYQGDLFELQHRLYEAGARNFMFIDLPPINRCPAVRKEDEEWSAPTYMEWNTRLSKAATTFAMSHAEATVLLFSSYATFSSILDFPEANGFSASAVRKPFGAIWYDQLHPTSKVHGVLAHDIADFLEGVESVDIERIRNT